MVSPICGQAPPVGLVMMTPLGLDGSTQHITGGARKASSTHLILSKNLFSLSCELSGVY